MAASKQVSNHSLDFIVLPTYFANPLGLFLIFWLLKDHASTKNGTNRVGFFLETSYPARPLPITIAASMQGSVYKRRKDGPKPTLTHYVDIPPQPNGNT